MSEIQRLALVGHCGPDAAMLKHTLKRCANGATVELITDDQQLQRVLVGDALLLVNRVLDGEFAVSEGVTLIQELAGRTEGPRLMLVSNMEDAQQQAEQAGAYPGFGKDDLGDEKMQQRLEAAMAGEGEV